MLPSGRTRLVDWVDTRLVLPLGGGEGVAYRIPGGVGWRNWTREVGEGGGRYPPASLEGLIAVRFQYHAAAAAHQSSVVRCNWVLGDFR